MSEAKSNFSEQTVQQMQLIFDHFKDKNDQKVNIQELIEIISEMTKDKDNELLMLLLKNIEKKKTNERLSFNEFVERLDEELGEKGSIKGLEQMFKNMADLSQPSPNTITFPHFLTFIQQIGYDTTNHHKWNTVYNKLANADGVIDQQSFQIYFLKQQAQPQ